MQLRKTICSFVLGASMLTACANLEEEPYGFTNTKDFYKTEAEARAALTYAYAGMPEVGYYSRIYYVVTEVPTENLTIKGDAGADQKELDELRTVANNDALTVIWGYMYNSILRANAVIVNVPNAPIAENVRQQLVAEAQFLRALHYFNLVRLYGAVPLRTEPITVANQSYIKKSPIDKVYELIIADLKASEAHIGTAKIEGRANVVAVQSLLAKVYLHLASSKSSGSKDYGFVTDADQLYTEARTYAEKVVKGQSMYGFVNRLRDIFNTDVYKKAAVGEHILDVAVDQSGENEGNYSKLPSMFIPALGRDMYIDDDGKQIKIESGWNHFQMENGIYGSYADNDKRKTELIATTVKDATGTSTTLSINDWSRPFTLKFLDPARTGDKSSVNSSVIRYSDILLVYAEACGPTAEGYAAINQIRNRAGIGDLPEGLSVADFRQAVLQERKWELAFEGHRLFDLRRTNQMEAMAAQYGKTITGDAYFFAIPQKEADTNPEINN